MIVKNYQRLVYEKGELTLASPMGPVLWLRAYEARTQPKLNLRLVLAYLSGQTLVDCLKLVENRVNRKELEKLVDWFVSILRKMPLEDLVEGLRDQIYSLPESRENIPQISAFDAQSLNILGLLVKAGRPLTYSEIGYHLYPADANRTEIARKKYGENAAKFAAVLGLVDIGREFSGHDNTCMCVRPTEIGYAVERASGSRADIVARLLFKLALFRDLVCTNKVENSERFKKTIDLVTETTRHRRVSAFTWMLDVYQSHNGPLDGVQETDSLLCYMRR